MRPAAVSRNVCFAITAALSCALTRAAAAQPDGGVDGRNAAESHDAATSDTSALDTLASSHHDAVSTATLRGRVLALGTRTPLGGASLSVDGVPAGEAASDGSFSVTLALGFHVVQVQHPRHETLRRQVLVGAPELEAILRLAPSSASEPYETIVRAPPEGPPRVAVSGEEAREIPGAFGDPLRALESLPGVQQVFWPAALYVVRGANPGNTGFFIDGLRVPALFHLAVGPSVIHPYFIEGLDFFPGGYPARYGRYVSGIVAARTTAPPADRAHASADLRLYDAGGIVTTPIGRGTLAVAGRYSYTGLLFSVLSETTTLHYGDYQVRADHPLASGRATLFWFGSYDAMGVTNLADRFGGSPGGRDMSDLGPRGQGEQRAQLSFHRLDLRWAGTVGDGRLHVATGGAFDRTESRALMVPFRVRKLGLSPRLLYERALGARADLELGWDAEAQRFDGEVEVAPAEAGDVLRPRSALSQGIFAGMVLRLGERVVIDAGFRASSYAEQDVVRLEPEPRLSVRVRVTDGAWLALAIARATQMPSLPSELPGLEAFSLATLGPQVAWQASLGAEVALAGPDLHLGVTGYGQKLRLTDVRSTRIQPLPNPFSDGFLEARDARTYGLELLLRRPPERRVFGWVSYTLSWSERAIAGAWGASDWDQRHNINLVAGARLPGRFEAGARVSFHAGRPVAVRESGPLSPDVEYRRLPDSSRLDLRLSRRFLFDALVLDVYIDVGNVTREREAYAYVRNMRDGSVVAQTSRVFLPTLGLRGEL